MSTLFLRLGLPFAVGVAVLVTPTFAIAAPTPIPIQILDDCDAVTFNAAIGPGTCVGTGAITFTQFLSEVTAFHQAPQWRFAPNQMTIHVGQPFTATNLGGETHSFTEVDQFGGGLVPILNDLSGAGPTRPECFIAAAKFQAHLRDSSFLTPGQSFTDSESSNDLPGPVLYQCCIHPWMHETLTVQP